MSLGLGELQWDRINVTSAVGSFHLFHSQLSGVLKGKCALWSDTYHFSISLMEEKDTCLHNPPFKCLK